MNGSNVMKFFKTNQQLTAKLNREIMKLQFENILKIADIQSAQLYPEFVKWLQNTFDPTYRDQILKEHIYNVNDIIEEIELYHSDVAPMFINSLEAIHKYCTENECGYFRVLYS